VSRLDFAPSLDPSLFAPLAPHTLSKLQNGLAPVTTEKMKLATLPVAVRHVSVFSGSKSLGALASRHYATQTSSSKSTNPSSKRRAVTPFNDDGRVNWTDLSRGEKAARATQQTFNFGFILAGLGLTVSLGLQRP